jgi:hypothetical protein
MRYDDLKCIACGHSFDAAFGDLAPYGSLIFSPPGNYGSTLFDYEPIGRAVVALICDHCIRSGNVMEYMALDPVVDKKPWNPDSGLEET